MTARKGTIATSLIVTYLQDLASKSPYLALMLSDPYAAVDPLTTEVSGAGYARAPVTWTQTGRLNYNVNQLLWPSVPAGTTVNFIAGFSAATNGTIAFAAQINGGLAVPVTQAVQLAANAFFVGFDTT